MAEDQDQASKTEDPTPKKLQESRKKGQVPLSREVGHWFMILAGTMLAAFVLGPAMADMVPMLRGFLANAHVMPGAPGGIGIILNTSGLEVLRFLFLPLVFLMVMAFIGPFMQVGPLIAPESIKPDINKINPVKGVQRLFSPRSLMEFVKGILKLAIISVVITIMMWPYLTGIENTIYTDMVQLMQDMKKIIVQMLIGILVVLIIVAVIDVVFQRYEHFQKMKMTKQEVKDEFRQMEGDPLVKQQLRQIRMDRARQKMLQAVSQADVVVTNPTHYAVALKYNPDEQPAPMVVAKGVDHLALRIRELAKEHKIEIVENKPLARTLFDTAEVDEFIPVDLYKAVAEIISFVFKKRGKI